jgi:hypothetical protein
MSTKDEAADAARGFTVSAFVASASVAADARPATDPPLNPANAAKLFEHHGFGAGAPMRDVLGAMARDVRAFLEDTPNALRSGRPWARSTRSVVARTIHAGLREVLPVAEAACPSLDLVALLDSLAAEDDAQAAQGAHAVQAAAEEDAGSDGLRRAYEALLETAPKSALYDALCGCAGVDLRDLLRDVMDDRCSPVTLDLVWAGYSSVVGSHL